MWGIAVNILSELILIFAAASYVLFTNRAELLKKLGYKNTYMDIPYDPAHKLVLLVKARIPDFKAGVYVLPQTSKTRFNMYENSLLNAEELGLGRNLYNPKLPLKYTGKSNTSRKSYQLGYIRVSKDALILAAKKNDIPWTYDNKKDMFTVRGVKYTEAMFTTPEKALDILIKNSRLGPRPNFEKADVYTKGFKMLKKLF
jgi:hypothetical protein